jgi:hypothetical protein
VGDILRKITVCGLNSKGDPLNCQTVTALIDTGATQTVISSKIDKKLGGFQIPQTVEIENREVRQRLAAVELDAPGCRANVIAAAVDDELVARAGNDEDGAPIQAILGHDYLQRERGALRYAPKGEVACRVGPLKPRKKR